MIQEWADGEDQEKAVHDERQQKQYDNDCRGDARRNDNHCNDNSQAMDVTGTTPSSLTSSNRKTLSQRCKVTSCLKASRACCTKNARSTLIAVIPHGSVMGSRKHSKMVPRFQTSIMNLKTPRVRRRRTIATLMISRLQAGWSTFFLEAPRQIFPCAKTS